MLHRPVVPRSADPAHPHGPGPGPAPVGQRRIGRVIAGLAALALAGGAAAWPGMQPAPDRAAAPTAPAAVAEIDPATLQARLAALTRAQSAVVRLRVQAVDDAVTTASLGAQREGSGVVIEGGLVLTVSYLLLEAERIDIDLGDDRVVPGTVAGIDLATGFALVRPLVSLKVEPVPLGRSGGLGAHQPLVSISGGDDGSVEIAQLVSQRPFSGTWEYHLDQALYTAPARDDHSGAALFNLDGELVGVGSLRLRDVHPPEDPSVQPGNLYLPVDLLTPILAELRSTGSGPGNRRPWLGLNASEADGTLRVLRVNRDGPAAMAGLRPGDRIESVDGEPVRTLEQLYKSLWKPGPAERAVTLAVRRAGAVETVTVQAVQRESALRRSRGI